MSAAEQAGDGSAGRMTAAEAARRLGVRRDTLYAYVSRGLIRSEEQQGTRERLYHAEDVNALLDRKQARRDPGRVAAEALHWGAPLLESRLTLIRDGALFYRGQPAERLIEQASFEDVVGLLWNGTLGPGLAEVVPRFPALHARIADGLDSMPVLERFQLVLAAKAAEDVSGFDLTPAGVRRVGSKILRLLGALAVGSTPTDLPLARMLRAGWAPRDPQARSLIDAALILWADHELNVSTFTVRCVVSARATPYAAVLAGLSALRGGLHGGVTEQVEALFDEVDQPERARRVLESRLRRGELIPGFGHSLYPNGDPRARLLLDRIASRGRRKRADDLADAIQRECGALIEQAPNIDFATVALRRALGLPEGSAVALFALARTAGWIAHALEQYESGRLIRPRARYTGPLPD
jgi:citrate synthase